MTPLDKQRAEFLADIDAMILDLLEKRYLAAFARLDRVRTLLLRTPLSVDEPPPNAATEREAELQAISFAAGNVAIHTGWPIEAQKALMACTLELAKLRRIAGSAAVSSTSGDALPDPAPVDEPPPKRWPADVEGVDPE